VQLLLGLLAVEQLQTLPEILERPATKELCRREAEEQASVMWEGRGNKHHARSKGLLK
jgi:hypothetical protein